MNYALESHYCLFAFGIFLVENQAAKDSARFMIATIPRGHKINKYWFSLHSEARIARLAFQVHERISSGWPDHSI